MLNQDLHIHTIYSTGDSSVVEEQTVGLIAAVSHAGVIGISDHFEYYIYHCRDCPEDYRGIHFLLDTGKPVIVAHPMILDTDLSRVPGECLVEINNRYVWRGDFRAFFGPYLGSFRYVLSSDAHQPNWLNQSVARYAADALGVAETVLSIEVLNRLALLLWMEKNP